MNLLNILHSLQDEVDQRLANGESVEELRSAILGRKGKLGVAMSQLAQLELEERRSVGPEANRIKAELEAKLSTNTGQTSSRLPDITVPSFPAEFGTIHPVSAMIEEMVSIFEDLSFEVVEGPEIVTEEENFETLNIHQDHPARDSHDTFFLNDGWLLRTQTSAVQVPEISRRVKNKQLPIRIVVPGKTYRRESDQTHSAMFHQIEGVLIDSQATFSDLKGVLDYVARRLFGEEIETRFRPHFFPFTEPSAEMDIRLKNSTGTGKQTGWLEWLGCGMIHPKVLEHAGLNPRTHQGWAFGSGIERPIMIRKQVPDLRRFFENSVPFLNQFSE